MLHFRGFDKGLARWGGASIEKMNGEDWEDERRKWDKLTAIFCGTDDETWTDGAITKKLKTTSIGHLHGYMADIGNP